MTKEARQNKPIHFMGTSLADLRDCPEKVKDEIGYALWHAEQGERHASMKTMKGFGGASVQEIRADDPSGTYRAVFTVKFAKAVYVLHVFQKKSKSGIATPRSEIDLIKNRIELAREHHEATYGN